MVPRSAAAALLAACMVSCSAPDPRPNVLWIVWDTVRADRMSLYGHAAPTTPGLDAWAAGARVYEDCLSTAGYTLPSHASMLTGLFPSEHCTHNGSPRLADAYVTLPELLHEAGYRTFLFSANPHISEVGNFTQGFDVTEYPWSERWSPRALEIVRAKLIDEDRSHELVDRMRAFERGEAKLITWNIKAAGELARESLDQWLDASGDQKPFFAFLNYMEAHRPYITPREFREKMMDEGEIARSYRVDRSWNSMWEYTFGLREYTEDEIDLTRKTYDAALAELDSLFVELMRALESRGALENTIVILTSDHGEHLGDKHMLDHQYSVYQSLLHVPLVIHFPERFAPGRDDSPVSHFDLFPTVLELTGTPAPEGLRSRARSLLSESPAARPRFAEEPEASRIGTSTVKELHPDWDPTPWLRSLRAWIDGSDKLIDGSDGRAELFDLESDPHEENDLAAQRNEQMTEMRTMLDAFHTTLDHCDPTAGRYDSLSPEQRDRLRSLGYL